MFTAMVVAITLFMVVLAFVVKDKGTMNPLLHFVCIMLWFVTGYTMYNNTPPTGNTFLTQAIFYVSIAMVIVHLITVINIYLGRRKAPLSYDDEKMQIRSKTFKEWGKNKRYWG